MVCVCVDRMVMCVRKNVYACEIQYVREWNILHERKRERMRRNACDLTWPGMTS